MNDDLQQLRIDTLSSLLDFTKIFYKLRTGRDFIVPQPIGRESHVITIMRELTKAFYGEITRLIINVPPGNFKSTIFSYFVAWCFAHYPDCQFLYISYSHDIAAKHTDNIKGIMTMPIYKKMFEVAINPNSSAKDNFQTMQGGAVRAFGSSGSITGQDAGLPNVNRFSGGALMDDMHKPDEVHSDTIREGVSKNFNETIKTRARSPNIFMGFIGQRLHEDDLPARLLRGDDGYHWNRVILKALDEVGNALNPMVHPKEMLLIEKQANPYVFASQYQQDPIPAGGGLYKIDDFPVLTEEPKMLSTFITMDTSETEKTYNDATVLSFWGVYRIQQFGVETDLYGIHWLDCWEEWVEPKDLQDLLVSFYTDCMRHPVKPKLIGIEKKSTGTYLLSTLRGLQGIQILPIERNGAKNSKTNRFIDCQPYISTHRVSLPAYAKHTKMCIDHMGKITANDSHRRDDIADTCADAIDLALIKRIISAPLELGTQSSAMMDKIRRSSQVINKPMGRYL